MDTKAWLIITCSMMLTTWLLTAYYYAPKQWKLAIAHLKLEEDFASLCCSSFEDYLRYVEVQQQVSHLQQENDELAACIASHVESLLCSPDLDEALAVLVNNGLLLDAAGKAPDTRPVIERRPDLRGWGEV